jgi:hypothetical protein
MWDDGGKLASQLASAPLERWCSRTPQLHRWVLWPLHLRCHKSTTNRAYTLHSILRMFKAGSFRRRHSYRDAPANTVLSGSSPIDEMLDRLNTVRLFLPRAFSLEISLPFAKAPLKFADEIPCTVTSSHSLCSHSGSPPLARKNRHVGAKKARQRILAAVAQPQAESLSPFVVTLRQMIAASGKTMAAPADHREK